MPAAKVVSGLDCSARAVGHDDLTKTLRFAPLATERLLAKKDQSCRRGWDVSPHEREGR